MKVFQIGFNKCATKSLYHFFKKNGHKSIHWAGGKITEKMNASHALGRRVCYGLEDIVFWSDIVFLERHFEIIAFQYPDAKFIYNIRPLDDWIDSRTRHYNGKKLERIWYEPYGFRQKNIDLIQFWKSQWIIHNQRVTEFFSGVNSSRLLTYNIMKDSGKEIADFLPELQFKNLLVPHMHRGRKKNARTNS